MDNENYNFMNSVDITKKNSSVPKPPKKGEYMKCQYCGKIMKPEDFSKIPSVRKQEFKWQIHEKCRSEMLSQLDRSTPGLISERKLAEQRYENRFGKKPGV